MMRKAWDDIKSFVTVTMTLAYVYLTCVGKMTTEFDTLYKIIVAFYFGTQAEKLQSKIKGDDINDNNINANK